jgi:hypothetical protein
VSRFELYRYTHPDGRAKEWAWGSHPDQGVEVRWGRAGALVGRAVYPPSRLKEVLARALAKQCKGYRFVGWCAIDARGRPVAIEPASKPPGSSREPGRAAVPPAVVLPDLSRVDTGRDDYWF